MNNVSGFLDQINGATVYVLFIIAAIVLAIKGIKKWSEERRISDEVTLLSTVERLQSLLDKDVPVSVREIQGPYSVYQRIVYDDRVGEDGFEIVSSVDDETDEANYFSNDLAKHTQFKASQIMFFPADEADGASVEVAVPELDLHLSLSAGNDIEVVSGHKSEFKNAFVAERLIKGGRYGI